MAVSRLLFGLLSVAVILAARNLWHPVDQPAPALADITLWGLFTGAGFIRGAAGSGAGARAGAGPHGARAAGIGCAAVVSLTTAFVSAKLGVFVLSFLIGLGAVVQDLVSTPSSRPTST